MKLSQEAYEMVTDLLLKEIRKLGKGRSAKGDELRATLEEIDAIGTN